MVVVIPWRSGEPRDVGNHGHLGGWRGDGCMWSRWGGGDGHGGAMKESRRQGRRSRGQI